MRAAAISRRTPNPRLVKRHRSYSVEEVAKLLGVHKNTVREWIRKGLPLIDQSRPLLILGRDLAAFLDLRRRQNKRPCLPGQIYCVRCRQPQFPAGGMADYQALTPAAGNLVGLCPACDGLIYRRVSLTGYRSFKRPFRAVLRVGAGRASAGSGAESDVHAMDFGISGPLIGAIRGQL